MSTLTLDGTAAISDPAAQLSKADALRIAALAPLSIRPRQTRSKRCELDGQQISVGDAGRAARNRPYHRLSAASFLSSLCLADPVQRSRADHGTVPDDGLAHAGCRAGLDRPLSGADADVRVAGCD